MLINSNQNKSTNIVVENKVWQRFPIRTHLITPGEDLFKIIEKYVLPYFKKGDYLFISEKVVAITQNRAYPIDKIKVGFWAKILVKFVTKSKYGIGISIPQTMQLAINEVGLLRILLAAFCAAITKPFGIKGIFYIIAGEKVRGIDGPTPYTIEPYNNYATLIPDNPDKICMDIYKKFNIPTVIIDANDIGVNTLGCSTGIDKKWASQVFKDNPLGQTNEQTPLCIVRNL